jgi:HSP20 family molecular chaperone IbpA
MATLNCILHPHHVSLIRTPFALQSLLHSFEDRVDPYYEYDGARSHKGLGRPCFNVTETETAYLLDDEFPGVEDKSTITVEWLQNQVLIIWGFINPADTEKAADPFQAGQLKNDLHPAASMPSSPLGGLPFILVQQLILYVEHDVAMTNPAKVEIEAMTNKPQVHFPRRLLNERHIGECQRSFTFPMEVDADGMKANLINGLLRIVVPKRVDAPNATKSINIQ